MFLDHIRRTNNRREITEKISGCCSFFLGWAGSFLLGTGFILVMFAVFDTRDEELNDAEHFSDTMINGTLNCSTAYPGIFANYTETYLCDEYDVRGIFSNITEVCYKIVEAFCLNEENEPIHAREARACFIIAAFLLPLHCICKHVKKAYKEPADNSVPLLEDYAQRGPVV